MLHQAGEGIGDENFIAVVGPEEAIDGGGGGDEGESIVSEPRAGAEELVGAVKIGGGKIAGPDGFTEEVGVGFYIGAVEDVYGAGAGGALGEPCQGGPG